MMLRAPHSTLRTRSRAARPALGARALCALSLVACGALAACAAADEDADSAPDFGSFTGGAPGSGGTSGTPLSPPSGSAGSPTASAGSSNEQVGGNGTPIVGTGGTTGANSGASTGGTSNTGTAGTTSAGGSAQVDPNAAAGAGGAPPSGTGGSTGQPPVVTGPDIPCPADATFCSGFEGAALPAGSVFQPTYLANEALGGQVALDTAVFHAGSQSLHMPVGSNYYRMLAVPVPSNSFWVRLYTRSNVGLGAAGSTHASLFMASTLAPDGDYNGDSAVEISEQFGQVLLNASDSLFGTSGANPNGMPGTRLPDNTWTCMEAQFEGSTGNIHVFVDGAQIIDATGWRPPADFKSFRFGYLRFDSPARDVWMDDVVVAASRIGCQ